MGEEGRGGRGGKEGEGRERRGESTNYRPSAAVKLLLVACAPSPNDADCLAQDGVNEDVR